MGENMEEDAVLSDEGETPPSLDAPEKLWGDSCAFEDVAILKRSEAFRGGVSRVRPSFDWNKCAQYGRRRRRRMVRNHSFLFF
jgi:hypothetical protein